MTTATPIRVSDAPRITDNPDAMAQLRDGLANASAECDISGQMHVDSEDPAVFQWERMVNEAIAEIAPYVGGMLEQAIAKRLPWQSEPER